MNAEADKIEYSPEDIFASILRCESELAAAKAELQKAATLFGSNVAKAEMHLKDVWKEMEAYMAATGEYELSFPAPAGQAYIVNYSTPRQSVKVTDVEALPEDLVKIEKKPKLKEIGDRLKEGWQTNAAKFELGEKRLIWKAIKHGK